MKIEKVSIDKKTNSIVIEAGKTLSFPLSGLQRSFRVYTNIKKFFIDEELGSEAITLEAFDGNEETIHIDSFLEYGKDPDYYRNLLLYELSIALSDKVISDKVIKSHVSKTLGTSMTQVYRTLDTTNYSKSIDQVVKFLAVIGYKLDFSLRKISRDQSKDKLKISSPFEFLDKEEIKSSEKNTNFNGLKLAV